MELSMERCSHDVCGSLCTCKGRQALNLDLVLPDYCGDFKRILHCGAQPQLHTVVCGNKQLSSQGEVLIRLFYLNEDDEPDCVEHTLPFSVSCSARELPAEAVVRAKATVEYINCRVLSSRKVQLSGTVTVHYEVLCKTEQTHIQSIRDCETRTLALTCTAVCAAADKTFDLSEMIPLDDGNPPIAAVVRASAVPVVQSVEAVKDKVLVKGELQTELCYLTTDHVLRQTSHALPISQIIDVAGVTEDCALSVSLQLLSFYTQTRRDGNEEPRLFDLAAKVSALAVAYRDETLTVIQDCYMTRGTLEPTFLARDFELRRPAQTITHQLQQAVETGFSGAELLQTSLLDVQTDVTNKDGGFDFVHHVTVSLLLQDPKEGLQYLERTADLTHHEAYASDGESCRFVPEVTVRLNQAVLQEDGTVSLQCAVTVNGSVFQKQTEQVLTDAAVSEEQTQPPAELVLSFVKEGESLWQIAKRYRTTVASIREENDLSEDTLSEDRMLLIVAV